jgi:hypothetical protein
MVTLTAALAEDALSQGSEGGNGYVCCFCGRAIGSEPPDPCRLELRVNCPASPDMSQDLFCHASCLTGLLTPTLPTILDAIS